MKQKDYAIYVVTAFFVITLAIRLAMAFQTPHFSDDASYFALRQIDEITNTGTPLFNDPLSYGGRYYMFPPGFHYVLAFFNLFLPLAFVAKVIPNILASLLIFVVYFLTREITKNRLAAFYSAGISGFIPIFFQKTVNSVSQYSLAVPLAGFSIFCFIRMQKNIRYGYPLIIAITALTLVHQSALLLVIALVFYIVFLKIENIKESPAELEVVLFSSFLALLIVMLMYRQALLTEGLGIIWQNIPSDILARFYRDVTVLGAIAKIGIIPFFYGIVTIYRYLMKKKSKFTYLFISFALTIGILLLTEAIEIGTGLIYLGMILTILYSIHFDHFRKFIDRTKFASLKQILMVSLSITFILTQVFPSMIYAQREIAEAPSDAEIAAFEWARLNTEKGSKILSGFDDGHKIAYLSERKNVIDSNFINAGDTEEIYDDIKTIYSTNFETQAVQLLNKHNIKYIFVKDSTSILGEIDYAEDKCFTEVYNNSGVRIYRSNCRLE